MQPVTSQGTTPRSFGLGNLILMMGKDQVGATTVDVERLTQVQAAHRRALDVPPGTPPPPRALPPRLPGFARLPEGKVHRVMLALIDLDARPGQHLFKTTVRELAVVGKAVHSKIHVPVNRIRQPFGFQLLDERDHRGNVMGGTRFVRGR